MKNATLLKIASLFIFLLTAQISFGQDVLFHENFNESDGPNAQTFTGQDEINSTNWTATLNGSANRWRYRGGEWETKNVYTESSLVTDQFSIENYNNLEFSIDIDFDSNLDCAYGSSLCDEWVKVFYTVGTNTEQFLTAYYGEGTDGTFTANLPESASGSLISLRIEILHDNNKDKHTYSKNNYIIFNITHHIISNHWNTS